jgi:hypothetical protein
MFPHTFVTRRRIIFCDFQELDESGIILNAKPKKVLTSKHITHTYWKEPSKHHDSITNTQAVAADGYRFRSQVIFKKSFARMEDILDALIGMV